MVRTQTLMNLSAHVTEGLQAVQLEDGSTAYIAHNPPENIFVDSAALDPNSLNLEQLASQVMYTVSQK